MTVEPLFKKNVRPFYKKVLADKDVVRGVPFRITIQARNIGDKEFPGGQQEVKINYAGGAFSHSGPRDVPPISTGETQVILDDTLVPFEEGCGSVELKIKAKDGGKVEGYQRRLDKPVRPNGWTDLFYVVNLEHAVIMVQLERLAALVERRGK